MIYRFQGRPEGQALACWMLSVEVPPDGVEALTPLSKGQTYYASRESSGEQWAHRPIGELCSMVAFREVCSAYGFEHETVDVNASMGDVKTEYTPAPTASSLAERARLELVAVTRDEHSKSERIDDTVIVRGQGFHVVPEPSEDPHPDELSHLWLVERFRELWHTPNADGFQRGYVQGRIDEYIAQNAIDDAVIAIARAVGFQRGDGSAA